MKYLLITDIPPCENFTAGLVLNNLVKFLPKEDIVLCAIVNPQLCPNISPELNYIKRLVLPKPAERVLGASLPFIGGVISFFFEILQSLRVHYFLSRKIACFAKQQKIDALWVVLQGQTMVRLAERLQKLLSCPIYTQVWDPFGWWLRDNKIDKWSQKKLLNQFWRVLSSSESCATASWEMSTLYTRNLGIKNNPVIAGLPLQISINAATKIHESHEFIIGMAGQLYAKEEWNALLSTLDEIGWELGGRKVRIRILGGGVQLQSQSPICIEYLGWRNQEESIKALHASDILYLPYWFSSIFKEEAENSFPSKLVTYLASGRPVFCHAPEYSTPAKYIIKNNSGYVCSSLDKHIIYKSLMDVLTNQLRYAQYSKNGSDCFIRDFTLDAMKISFLNFLGN
jgi:glycosyltransferase involved in cell wall biosynthesis